MRPKKHGFLQKNVYPFRVYIQPRNLLDDSQLLYDEIHACSVWKLQIQHNIFDVSQHWVSYHPLQSDCQSKQPTISMVSTVSPNLKTGRLFLLLYPHGGNKLVHTFEEQDVIQKVKQFPLSSLSSLVNHLAWGWKVFGHQRSRCQMKMDQFDATKRYTERPAHEC